MTEQPLAGRTVMVTRPADQSVRLCRMIENAGGVALRFPVLEIAVAEQARAEAARGLLDDYTDYDAMIFISRNAVRFAEQVRPEFFSVEALPAIYAAGAGTQAELSARGIVAAAGAERNGAEGLLRLPSLDREHVAGRRLLIVRGEGGREYLKKGLERRGAEVEYAEVYRRRLPAVDADTLEKLWQDHRPDVIVITSVQSLENLLALTGPAHRQALMETPLAVISSRVGDRARELGFTREPCVASGASDTALTAAAIDAAARIG